MKRILAGGVALGMWVGATGFALAQSTLDALDQELKEAQQQHDDATAASLSNFFGQVDQAMGSSDAAVTLWQNAGGGMPAPTPVTTEYESESASERDTRLAKDKANADTLGAMLEIHCGLLHYGAIFISDPKRQGLQDQFNSWLEKAAQAYPQLAAAAAPPPADDDTKPTKHKRHSVPSPDAATGTVTIPPVNLGDVMSQSNSGSLITKFLSAVNLWKDKDQGGWSIKSIPGLFKSNILDPSRATPTQTTLANWDTYIAMQQANEPDPDKWTSSDYPPLQFDRACDDYAVSPGTDKLQILVQLIHTNPTDPNAPDWLTRTRALVDAYRAGHGGSPSTVAPNATPPPPSGNPNVTVTQQGDAQIITTHNTNAAPQNPAH